MHTHVKCAPLIFYIYLGKLREQLLIFFFKKLCVKRIPSYGILFFICLFAHYLHTQNDVVLTLIFYGKIHKGMHYFLINSKSYTCM